MFILLKVVVRLIVFLMSANLICRSTDISKSFIESLGVRDNESRLYIYNQKHCDETKQMVLWRSEDRKQEHPQTEHYENTLT